MMLRLSASASASSIEWVVMTTPEPFLNFLMEFHMNRLASGSMPVLGSSSRMALGLPMREQATMSFLLLPPENRPARLSPFILRFIMSISCSTLFSNALGVNYLSLP